MQESSDILLHMSCLDVSVLHYIAIMHITVIISFTCRVLSLSLACSGYSQQFKGAFSLNVDFDPPKSASEILRTNEIMIFFSYLCGDWTK